MLSVSKLGVIGAASSSDAAVENISNITFSIGLYQNKITDVWGYDRRLGDDPITNPSDPRYGTYNNHYQTQTETFGTADNDLLTIRGNNYRLLSLEWSTTGGLNMAIHDPYGDIVASDIISVTMPSGTYTEPAVPGTVFNVWVPENVSFVPIDVNQDGVGDYTGFGNPNLNYTQLRLSTGPGTTAWNSLVIGATKVVTFRTAA